MYSPQNDGRYIDHSAPCDGFAGAFHTFPKRKEIAAAHSAAKVMTMRNWLIENMTFIWQQLMDIRIIDIFDIGLVSIMLEINKRVLCNADERGEYSALSMAGALDTSLRRAE